MTATALANVTYDTGDGCHFRVPLKLMHDWKQCNNNYDNDDDDNNNNDDDNNNNNNDNDDNNNNNNNNNNFMQTLVSRV